MIIKFAFSAVCLAIAASGSTAFAQTPSTPHKRAHHEMVYDPSTRSVLLVGGSTPNPDESFIFFNDIWRYVNNTWSLVARAGDERSGIRLAYDSKRNKIYSFGGFLSNNQSSGQLRVLEGNAWKILTDLPDMKSAEPGFVYDSKRDKFIAFGAFLVLSTEIKAIQWRHTIASSGEVWTLYAFQFAKMRARRLLHTLCEANSCERFSKSATKIHWQIVESKVDYLP